MNHNAKTVFLIASIFLLFTEAIGQKKVTTISCGTCGQNAIYLPKPTYPAAAKAIGLNGKEVVNVVIDENGSVISASVSSGHAFFHRASLKAAYEAKFKPPFLSGRPVRVNTTIVYNFVKPAESSSEKSSDERPKADMPIAESGNLPIINGRAIYLPKPEYSQELMDLCAYGKVEIEVGLNEDGTVRDAKAISGDELLHSGALNAAKRAKFSPPLNPRVKSRGIVVYNFSSQNKCIIAGVVNSKTISRPVPPNIQHLNLRKAIEIRVRIVIDESGNVIAARMLSGHPIIKVALENAAKRTKFSGSMIGGPTRIGAILAYKIKTDGSVVFVDAR